MRCCGGGLLIATDRQIKAPCWPSRIIVSITTIVRSRPCRREYLFVANAAIVDLQRVSWPWHGVPSGRYWWSQGSSRSLSRRLMIFQITQSAGAGHQHCPSRCYCYLVHRRPSCDDPSRRHLHRQTFQHRARETMTDWRTRRVAARDFAIC